MSLKYNSNKDYVSIAKSWISKNYSKLDTVQRDAIKQSLKIARNNADFFHILNRLCFPEVWRFPKVSIDTFIDDPYYLNMSEQVRPAIRNVCREMIEGQYREGVLVAGIGCERVGTEILMFDGTIKTNDKLVIGDKVMGPDGTPRKVKFIHSGKDTMYEIVPIKGEKKYVIGKHKLSLVQTNSGEGVPGYQKLSNTIQNITVDEYLSYSKKRQGLLKLYYSEGVAFSEKELPIDPYFLGCRLGDGSRHNVAITTMDREISDYVYKIADSFGLQVTINTKKDNRASTYTITTGNKNTLDRNKLLDLFMNNNLRNNKHIPLEYKTSSVEQRLELLAGIIDTDGTKDSRSNAISISTKEHSLAKDYQFVAKSLGFGSNISSRVIKGTTYYNVSIEGDTYKIPVKLERKKCSEVIQNKNVLRTGIKEINLIGEEEYIGFEVDKDNLYCWSDFMVTHNTGKSFVSAILIAYQAQHLLCLRNPHSYYKLSKDKDITLINMGMTATQALDVVFASIKTFIEGAEFFKEWKPRIQSGSIHFDVHGVMLMSGNSKSTTPIGYNIFAGVLDEAAFYLDNDNKSIAEEIYNGLQRRITSRFGRDGLLMMISSPRYTEDFIMRKLEESRAIDDKGVRIQDHVYSLQIPTWKSKLPSKEEYDSRFYFNARNNQIMEETEEEIRKVYKVNDIYSSDFDSSYDVWEVPGEYYASFRSNPDKSKRDYGAVPSVAIGGFFPNPAIVKAAFNRERQSPLAAPGKYNFSYRPLRTSYYIHIDIGLNRDTEGDHTGFAMGRFDGRQYDEVSKETKTKFYIDLYERIGISSEKGEVDLAEVRQRIYDLKDMGFNIALVTLDGYQSKDTIQTLKKKGFRVEYLSVDRTVDAYNALKEAIYDKRIDMYYYEIVEQELVRLELIKGIKVDHNPGGSKDVTDALAGVVMNIVNEVKGSGLRMQMGGDPGELYGGNKVLQQEAEIRKKQEHYQRLERITQRQTDVANKFGL